MTDDVVTRLCLLLVAIIFLAVPPWIAHRKGYHWAPWLLSGIPGLVASCLLWRANRDDVRPEVNARRRWRGNALGIAISMLMLVSAAWRLFEARTQLRIQEAGRTWQVLDDDAKRLMQQGDYDNATPVAQEALRLAERIYGIDSPAVAASLSNLAAIYQRQQRHASAEPLLKRALDIQLRSEGTTDNELAASYYYLAWNYAAMNQDEYATLYFLKSLALLEKPGKPFDPAICRILVGLSRLSAHSGKYSDAESYLKRSCTSGQQHLPHGHPDVINAFATLGDFYFNQQRFADAEAAFLKVIAIVEHTHGEKSKELIEPLAGLVNVYKAIGRQDLAPQYERRLNGIHSDSK